MAHSTHKNHGKQEQGKGQEHEGVAGTFATVAEKAKEATESVRETAGTVATEAGHKMEEATESLGKGMRSLAGTIRERGGDGALGSAASTVAEGLETGGRYLEREGLEGMGADLVKLIRRNPVPAVLIGIGFGFLLARATSRS